jgi:polysaccharide biosynthesis transport protein
MQATPVMEEQSKDLADFINAIRRRRTAIVFIVAIIFLISALIAVLLPSVYRSSATILIEEQDIPSDMVRAAVTSFAVERIQTISQRVMTRSNLMDIIQKYKLYTRDKRTKTTEEIVSAMRNDIKLETINADVMDPSRGTPTKATIAFTLSFDGESPEQTQKVASELTNLFLNENLKTRTQQAEDTYAFLKEEADKLEAKIADYEKKLAEFKEKHPDNLPDLSQLNLSLVERTERDIDDIGTQLRSTEERKLYLEAQLAQISPSGPTVSSSGQLVPGPVSQLKALRSEYALALSKYSPNHPDVIRLKREIAAIEGQLGDVNMGEEQAKQLENLRTDLATARQKYSEDHPDVIKLKKEIASLESSLPKTDHPEKAIAAETPDNPAYLTMQAQLESAEADLKSLKSQREQLKAKLTDYETRIATAPQIEREYSSLMREHDNALLKFRDIKAKQMEAGVSKQLEKESMGERFSLIDPPAYPEKPISPNRPAILLLGFILSLGSGIGFAIVKDSMDNSINSRKGVAALMGVNPLGVIPYIANSQDRDLRKQTKRRWIIIFLISVVVGILLINFLWMPIDVIAFKVLRLVNGRLGE